MTYSQSNILDAPHSFLRNTKSVFKTEEKVRSVRDALNAELKGHVRVCDTPTFLDALLPIPNGNGTLQLMFDKLKKAKYDTRSQRWDNFPERTRDYQPLESLFYRPFILVAKAILEEVRTLEMENNLKGYWLDRHDKPPELTEESAKAHPDCLFVSLPQNVRVAEEGGLKLEKVLRESTGMQRRAMQERLAEQQSVWWRQIHLPVEIKKANDQKSFNEGIFQACTYLRLVLLEQLDRRFAFALLLCGEELTVLLNDRSGLVYTKDPINIHQEPLRFIQVIAALSILSPSQVGWDPQMKIYDPESRQSKPSYEVNIEACFFEPNLAKIHWEIDIPGPLDGLREDAITLCALSISRSEVMCGRATLVWEVIRKQELDIDDRKKKIFVLKRYWRPYKPTSTEYSPRFMPEGDRYRRIECWEDRIYSDEDIAAQDALDGSKDSTLEHIRRHLENPSRSQAKNAAESLQATKDAAKSPRARNSAKRPRDEVYRDHNTHVKKSDDNKPEFLGSGDGDVVSRVHTQIIHSYTGYSLRHFKDLTELLHVIRDIVEEHKHLYYNGLTLHRDISIENIIIMPRSSDTNETVGRLIDLDHAKVVYSSRKIEAKNDNLNEVHDLEQLCRIRFRTMNDEVLNEFKKYFKVKDASDSQKYVSDVMKIRAAHFGLDKTREITLGDMGWHYQVNDLPDFSKHTPRQGLRTGTLPFMSVEILKGQSVFGMPEDVSMDALCHDAIHDIESLFWVLTFICLVREGPGMNMLRQELRSDGAENDALQGIIYRYFNASESDEILLNKGNLFTNFEKLKADILLNFHSYFEPLRGMMVRWWHIMVLAYRHRKFEYYTIHSQIIDIIKKTMDELSESQDFRTGKEETLRREARGLRLELIKGKNKEPPFGTSGNKFGLDFSPERPIRVAVPYVSNIQSRQEPESPSLRHKKQKKN